MLCFHLMSSKQRPQTAQIPVRAKPCVVADGGADPSPRSFQSRDRDLKFSQSKSKTSWVDVRTPRVVANGGGEQSPQSLQSFDYEIYNSKFILAINILSFNKSTIVILRFRSRTNNWFWFKGYLGCPWSFLIKLCII